MARKEWIYRTGTTLALALMLAGCTGFKAANPKNFTRALNAYYSNNDDCLFASALRFPYEASTTAAEKDPKVKALDALAGAGLLKSLEDQSIHVKRYSLTTFGSRVPPRFCYGHRVATSIDNFTPPAPANGQSTTQVTYRYKMMDVPGWANSDSMRKAFPVLAQTTAADAQGHATLVLTQNGWRVPE